MAGLRMELHLDNASAKQRAVEAVQGLPENATIEDAIDCLSLLAKVEKGFRDVKAGRELAHREVRGRFLK
jgi:hypothetical protein